MSGSVTPVSPTAVTDPVIRLEDLTVRLSGLTILDGVNLNVQRGEFLAVIGPSGEGKSTLLRVIAGLQRPHSGKVEVASPPAMMFQDDRLLPWRTALRNVRLPRDLGAGGTLSPEEALSLVGMSEYAAYYPAQLSGGMRARVSMARALAQSGDILLLDEPFAALDALVRERFNTELRHLHDKTGQTTILVTHSIREAVLLADRVAVLRGGRLLEVLDTRGEGRISAYTDGLEAHLRSLLGAGDSTRLRVTAGGRTRLDGLAPVVAVLAVLAAWWLGARALNDAYLLPGPAAVWNELARTPGDFLNATWETLRVTLLGALLGGLVGMLIGYPLGKIRALERLLSPFVVAAQSTPIVVLAPLLVIWFGFGTLPAVLVSALSALYPIMISTMVGVREVRLTDHELFTTLGAGAAQRLFRLELPSALPVMLGGLRLSLSLALIGAVVWEFVSNRAGLGFLVNQAGSYYNSARKFAAITLLIVLGIGLYMLVTTVEKQVLRYRGR